MHVSWKAIGERVRVGNWSPMAWAMLALILVCVAATAIVGVELYAVTAHPAQTNPR